MSDGKNLILNWYLDALQFFRQLSLVTFGSHPCCWQMMMILSNFSLMHLWMVSGQVWHCHYCTPWEFLFSEPAYVTDGVFVYLYLLELKPIIHLNCKSFYFTICPWELFHPHKHHENSSEYTFLANHFLLLWTQMFFSPRFKTLSIFLYNIQLYKGLKS